MPGLSSWLTDLAATPVSSPGHPPWRLGSPVTLRCRRVAALPALRIISAALTAMPNIPSFVFRSASGQMMVWYSGCRSAKVVKPACESMSSTSMTPPFGMAEAACSISNNVFSAVCRLSWMNSSTWPTSAASGGSRCLLEPSRYDQRGRQASVTTMPVSPCSR